MKIQVSENRLIDEWEQANDIFNFAFKEVTYKEFGINYKIKHKESYVIIHHNKIIKIKHVNFFTKKEINISNDIDFELNRHKGGIYLLKVKIDDKNIIFNAKMNFIQYCRIKYFK
jgi:hypothetical protein